MKWWPFGSEKLEKEPKEQKQEQQEDPRNVEIGIARAKLALCNIATLKETLWCRRGVCLYAFLPEIAPFRAQLTANEVNLYLSRKFPDVKWEYNSETRIITKLTPEEADSEDESPSEEAEEA